MRRQIRVVGLVALLLPVVASGQPLLSTNPVIPPNLQISTFASGLELPYGMYQLPDGSMLVATSAGLNHQIVRYTQTNGVASAATTVYSGGAGVSLGLAGVGNIVALSSGGADISRITMFEAGAGGALTSLGVITFDYPPSYWEHDGHAIAMRAVPGQPNTYQLVFNVGSAFNDVESPGPVTALGLLNETLNPNSIYSVELTVSGGTVSAAPARQLASGLRNAFALGFNPGGDLYFGENGIDLNNTNTPVSTDFFGIIASGASGVLDFGFPNTYYDPVDGHMIGPAGAVMAPFVKFLPVGGMATQGVAGLALAPSAFPSGLNSGAFFGFFGKLFSTPTQNDLGGVLYVDTATGQYFSLIPNAQSGLNHPTSLFATSTDLYVADFGDFGVANGAIFRVSYATTVPEPSSVLMLGGGLAVLLLVGRQRCRRGAST